MLLGMAARFDRVVRKAYSKSLFEDGNTHFQVCRKEVMQLINNMGGDAMEILDICYAKSSKHPEVFASPEWVRDNICEELDIPHETWNEKTSGMPMAMLLSEESPEFGGAGWTVKQALMIMHNLKENSVLQTAKGMNKEEAPLFWARVLGEKPPMPLDRFLQIAAEGRQYKMGITKVREMLMVESPFTLLTKIIQEDDIPHEPMGIQPGQPFKGPVYHIWSKAVLPEKMYLDTIKGQRRYLHIVESMDGAKGILYNREGQKTGNLPQIDIPVLDGEHVFEVEMVGGRLMTITDYLSCTDDWYLYEKPYAERFATIPDVTCKVKKMVLAEGGNDVSTVLDSTEDTVRLVSSGPFTPGGDGGWILSTTSYEYNLLLSSVKRDHEYQYHGTFSVLDGFEPREVMEVPIPTGMVNHLRNRLANAGILVGHEWMPVEEEAIIFNVEVKSVLPDITIGDCDVMKVDDNLGYSDASQITDLAEMLI